MPIINSPKIITFEGPDNCGKTTIIEGLKLELTERGYKNVKIVRQPASTPYGEIVYNLHHQYEDVRITGFARQLLHASAHFQFYQDFSEPYDLILMDRSFVSSLAYAYAFPSTEHTRELEANILLEIHTHLMPQKFYPNMICVFGNEPYDHTDIDFENYDKVRKAYTWLTNWSVFKSYLKLTKCKLANVRNDNGKQETTIKTLADIIETSLS